MTARKDAYPMPDASYLSAADMVAWGRVAMQNWREAPADSAAERRAGRWLAFAFNRLDSLGVLDAGAAAVDKSAQSPPAG